MSVAFRTDMETSMKAYIEEYKPSITALALPPHQRSFMVGYLITDANQEVHKTHRVEVIHETHMEDLWTADVEKAKRASAESAHGSIKMLFIAAIVTSVAAVALAVCVFVLGLTFIVPVVVGAVALAILGITWWQKRTVNTFFSESAQQLLVKCQYVCSTTLDGKFDEIEAAVAKETTDRRATKQEKEGSASSPGDVGAEWKGAAAAAPAADAEPIFPELRKWHAAVQDGQTGAKEARDKLATIVFEVCLEAARKENESMRTMYGLYNNCNVECSRFSWTDNMPAAAAEPGPDAGPLPLL